MRSDRPDEEPAAWHVSQDEVARSAARGLAEAARTAARSVAKKPYVPAWNSSDIWDRALTESERSGAFENADDLKALLGPAGVNKGWHHIVEANAAVRFGAKRVHNVGNFAPIEQKPLHNEISGFYQDRSFHIAPNGERQSLRMYLQDKSWAHHVAIGEQVLRDRGLEPERLRAETVARFEERLALHALVYAPTHAAAAPLPPLHVERDGVVAPMLPGQAQEGSILSVEGDRVVQHVGLGHSATYSRRELAAHSRDAAAFETLLQPGTFVDIRVGRDGEVDIQQREPGRGRQSLGHGPSPVSQQHREAGLGLGG